MPTYAQQTDLASYLIDSDVTAPTGEPADRLLVRCEFEVDSLLAGFGAPDDTTGLKYTPASDLTAPQAAALVRAVCAQAEYHLIMGDAFFAQWQYDSWQGPDFAAKGKLGYFSPRVALELAGQGIARTAGVTSVSTSWYQGISSRLGLIGKVRAN